MAKIYSPYLATGTIETVTNNGFKKVIQYVCEQTGNTITVRPAPEMSEGLFSWMWEKDVLEVKRKIREALLEKGIVKTGEESKVHFFRYTPETG